MIDNNKIVSILYEIADPVGGSNIIDTGRVRNLKINNRKVYFELVVTGLDAGVRAELNFACQEAIRQEYEDADVHVHMTADKIEEKKMTPLPQVKNIIAIASGKGGVGKSTISANVARAMAAQGLSVGLLDADLYGPSQPLLFGMEGQKPEIKEVHGKAKITPLVTDEGIHLISLGFIIDAEQAVVLRGPRLSGVIKQFINETIWPSLDVLILDLPPGTGDIQLTIVQTVPVTGAVIVTTPQDVAIADALKAANMFRLPNINVPLLGVVENMAWFTPHDLPDRRYEIFGQGGGARLASMVQSVILGQIPLVMEIRASGDQAQLVDGTWIRGDGWFAQVAQGLLAEIKKRNESYAPTKRVEVN